MRAVSESWVGKRVWLYNGQRNGRWMGTAAEYLVTTMRCVRANGSIAIYASNGDHTPRLPVGEPMQRNISLYPLSLPDMPHAARKRARSDIAQWIESGTRTLSVAERFPLYEAAAAHEAVGRGDKVGTVVIECAR